MVRSFRGFARCTFLSVTGLLALLILPAVLLAQQTIHVPADQPTIQAAINVANNGDTVLVAPGTYVENINFIGKAITVTSSGGPSVTIIDGGANATVVIFANSETPNSVLSRFTIRNGLSQFSAPTWGSGGGIYITSASPTISGNVVTNNQAGEGAGISIQFASPIIEGNIITSNHQCCGSGGTGGGGILIGGVGSAQILNNTIANNVLTSAEGGGISLFAAGTPIIQGNLISGNSVSGGIGGGIVIYNNSDALIVQNVIVGNIAGQGAGVAALVPSGSRGPFLVNNTIANNNSIQLIGSGVLIEGFDTQSQLINNIIVGVQGQNAVSCGSYPANLTPIFQSNDIFAPQGSSYAGNCTDQSGLNGNISADPLFMSAANGDFHLKLGSPAVGAGDNSAPNLPATDFDGNPRIVDGNNRGTATVDLGAYEVGNTSAASLSPVGLGFLPQQVGVTSAAQPAILNSSGATAFQVTSIQTTGDFTQNTTCPVITSPGSAPGVASGNSCGFNVFFTPTISGPGTGLLTVNGTNGTSLQVSLSGTGFTPAPTVSLTPSPVSFSPQLVGTTSGPQPVTLTNTGNASLSISSIAAAQPFAQTNDCFTTLVPGANCTINVTFQPIVSGNATGTLTILDNAAGSPHTVNLSGMGNPIPQPVAITLVQHTNKDAGTATSASLAFTSNNTSGNWIAVAIRAGHAGQSFTVKDSNGNAYHQAVQFNVTTDAPNGDTLGIFYAENIAGGANQVTVSDTISSTMRIAILEYSGVASANSLDTTAAAQGSSKTPNSGSLTTSANGDLLLGAVLTANGENFTAGAGYLIEEHVPAEPNTKLIVEDEVQSASGTVSAGASMAASDNWGAATAAFKSATTSVSTSPTITSLNPTSGVLGALVTITGTNFGSTQGASTVTFNGGPPATPTNWSATAIMITVPPGATTGNVVVTVGGVASNGVGFTVIPPPGITSLTPSSGQAGTTVAIAGANFGATQGTSTVTFNGATATPTSWSPGSISVPVPAGATTGNVIVTVGGIASNGLTFTVILTPNISSLSPTSGPPSTIVTISGTNFGLSQGTSTVAFNGTLASPTSWTAGVSIVAPVPVGTTSGNAVVTVGGVASNGVAFNLIPISVSVSPLAPTVSIGSSAFFIATVINDVSNNVPKIGVTWTLSGPGCSGSACGTVSATVASPYSDSYLAPATLPSPPTVNITATSIADPTKSATATINLVQTSAPNISSLSPTSGPVTTPVTIAGANFGASQGTSTVTFNGIAATPTSWGATAITVPVPVGATTGNVVVSVGGVPSNGVGYTVTVISVSVMPAAFSLPADWSTLFAANIQNDSQNNGVTWSLSGAGCSGNTCGTLYTTPGNSSTGYIAPPSAPNPPTVILTATSVADPTKSGNATITVTPVPSITSLSPPSGPITAPVTITGANFGATKGTGTVTFNGTPATTTNWSSTTIIVPVPAGATTGNVVVMAGGAASNGVAFMVTGPPGIISLNPTSAPVGASVTIAGANFGATQGTSTVTFNGIAAIPTSWSATSIVSTVPTGAATGNVVVTVGGVASNSVSFTVAPTIASIAPLAGQVGTPVTITGTNFGATQGTSTITFNGTLATPTGWSATSIVAPVPAGTVSGNVVVTVGGVASNNFVPFTVFPVITSLNPSSGPVGTPFTINGSNFGATRGFSSISFNTIPVVATNWGDTSIVSSVPTGATTGNVVVTAGGFTSNGVSFTVTPSPNITNLSPSVGPVGTSVTISGSNFGATQGSSRVLFNGAPATPSSWSATSIVAPVPVGASTGIVYVVLNGVAVSNGMFFTVGPPPPTITSLTPASGPVSTFVTIAGANFGSSQGSSTVTFNGTAANPTAWSTTSITVPVPAGATTGNVFVTVGGVSNFGVYFTVTTATANISLVQHTSKDAGTTSSSSLPFNTTNTAGNFIAVVIRAGKSGQGFSVSDSRGNVYKPAVLLNMTVDADTVGIYYAENIAGGANTITVSDTILGTLRFSVLEYSGVAASSSLDVTAAAEGTSSTPATGTVTTNFSGDLLLGEVITANPATFNPGSGYTIEERVPVEPNTKLIVEDQRQSISGSAVAGASLGVSDHWGAVLAAFRHP